MLGLLAIVGVGLIRTQQGPAGVGSKPNPFTLRTFDGVEYNTADLVGQVVVINFWASWCKPCEQEAAELEQAYQQFKDQGVVFLGVNYVDTEPEAKAYLERFGITYPNGPDLGTRISQAFRIRGVPETYILGAGRTPGARQDRPVHLPGRDRPGDSSGAGALVQPLAADEGPVSRPAQPA